MTPSSAPTRDKTNRACTEALRIVQGVYDDLGPDEAIVLYQAQTAAFIVVIATHFRNKAIGAGIAVAIVSTIAAGITKEHEV